MSAFPDDVVSPRTISNRPGVEYNPDDTKTLFAEDLNNINDEIVAIETELGANPKGVFASIAEFLETLRAAVFEKDPDVYYATINGPTAFTSAGAYVNIGTLLDKSGIFTSDETNDWVGVSETRKVKFELQMSIAHSSIVDSYHLDILKDGAGFISAVSSCYLPVSQTTTITFTGVFTMEAGSYYQMILRCNGGSGTHNPTFAYSPAHIIYEVVQ